MTLGLAPLLTFCAMIASGADGVSLQTAAGHPMQYYLSLPKGWSVGKEWPVVMAIESANRQFEAAAELYTKARGDLPFILAVPLVVTNGGPRYRQVPAYRYSEAVWTEIERDTCRFDFDGMTAVAADVHKRYGGEEKYFLTGLEAAGHTIWAYVFRYPENLRAAAPVSPNYAGRCMEGETRAPAALRAALPVRVFAGADAGGPAAGILVGQTQRAMETARDRGFRNVAETRVADKGHEPLAEEVLAWFDSVWKQRSGF